ncbi:MAG: excisionase family DNA-binding protein [Bacteroidales bacterium]|nr:excisionase family DNA-binding protein [Bacteroidales bacterium]
MQERWYAVEETAQYMGIKKETLCKWLQRKDLPAYKGGRLWRFMLSEVDEWVSIKEKK